MIKVIKEGKIPEKKRYEKVCTHCGTVFTYEEDDPYMRERKGRVPIQTIDCPLCDNHLTHDEKTRLVNS